MPQHLRRLATAAAASLLALAAALPAQAAGGPLTSQRGALGKLTADQVTALAAQADQPSFIIFKNQHAEAPAAGATLNQRRQAVEADQAPVKGELAQLRAPRVRSFHIINAVSATISKAEAERLAADPSIQAVVPDLPRRIVQRGDAATTGAAPDAQATAATGFPVSSDQVVCPADPSVPLLEPEALQVMHVENQAGDTRPAAHDLADGSGVKVALIADGVDIKNSDLMRNGQSIVFDYQNFSGLDDTPTDGRESFLDAGSIAAQGNTAYDLSAFVNPAHPLPPGCNIRIKGVAPGASLAIMNVSGGNAGFFNSTLIQAIERAVVVDHVDILNESFGGNPFPDSQNDPVALADSAAVKAGVTVVVSSGDAGPTNAIGAPASDP